MPDVTTVETERPAASPWLRWRSAPLLVWMVLALGSGALWGLVFRSHPDAVLPWFALVPLFVLFEISGKRRWPRRGVLLGALHGLGAWLASIYWIAPTLAVYGGLPGWFANVLLVLVCLYLGLYHGAFIGLGAGLWRRGGLPALFGLPALWVSLEVVRGWLLSGFPWNLAGYAWVEVEGALPLSAWIGTFGLSYLLVMVTVGWALLLLRRRVEPAVLAVLVALLLLALGARRGEMMRGMEPSSSGSPVRLLQPNIENLVEYDPEIVGHNYARLLEMSRASCDASGPLLIWPESAAWPFQYGRDARLRADLAALTAAGCSVLVNTPLIHGDDIHNGALLLSPEANGADGIAGRYAKNHLVPYGEYVPLGKLLPFIGILARNAGQFTAADSLDPLPWSDERLGLSICYEVVFAGQVAAEVAAGATILVTITNDAWYGDTSAPWQHLRAARFRAAETRRPMLRAAITGVSAVIGPDGSIRDSLGVGEQGVLAARVAGRTERSPYSRAPWLVPAAAVVFSLVAIWFYALERPQRPPAQ